MVIARSYFVQVLTEYQERAPEIILKVSNKWRKSKVSSQQCFFNIHETLDLDTLDYDTDQFGS